MAMDFKKTFGYNKTKAREGMWVTLDEAGEVKIKVAKLGTVEYLNTVNKYSRKYQAFTRLNRLSAEQIVDMSANTIADCILLDWKGVEEDGQPVPYSRENAYRMLKEYDDFRSLVETHANDPDLFQDNIIDLESDSKNLPATSNGT
jgi:hypothetical protein